MRVNPNPLSDLLAALQQTQQQINNDLAEISSGRSVNLPSDNPAAAAALERNADKTAEADQFSRSIGSVQAELQNADSTLNAVTTALQRAISLGVEGGNSTLNASDRAALANEVQGIQSQLLSLANLSYQGHYVFAGTATQSAPYVLDPTASSGVRYAGNSGVNHITLGDHFTVQTNQPGSQLFSNPGHDVFQSLQDLITNLQSGNTAAISTAVSAVSDAANYLNSQRVFYGNSENQLNSQQTFLNSEITQLSQEQNSIGGADLPKVITDLTTAQTTRQATLEAVSQTQQTNLFSYIK